MDEILIVDDSPAVRLQLRDAIGHSDRRSARVHDAATPEEAITLFRERPVSVVFHDMTLPGRPGAAHLMERLLKLRPDARIVLVTALPRDDPHVRQAFSRGAYEYVEKPVRTEAVVAVFERMGMDDGRLNRIA